VVRALPIVALVLLLSLAAISAPVFAQLPQVGPTLGQPTSLGTVRVFLRTEDGKPLPQKVTPVISLLPAGTTTALSIRPEYVVDGWVFDGVGINGDYDVIVTAPDYLPAREKIHLPNTPAATTDVIVFMHPVDQALIFHRPVGQFVLPPRAEKEVQRALQDLQLAQVPSAIKHAKNAVQLAPENPYVQFVMGMTYMLSGQWKLSKPFLEKSVSLDPRQPLVLTALGSVRYRLNDDAGAAEVLSKAVELDATSWKAEWLLAASYVGIHKYQEAREHAEHAIKLGQDNAAQARLVLGQALAGLGQREAAAKELDQFAADFPSDPNAAQAKQWAKQLREPPKTVAASTAAPGSLRTAVPDMEIPPRADWAPPDVDAAKPFIVSTAACPLAKILQTTGANAAEMVNTLQQFTAKEDFQEIELKRGEQAGRPKESFFDYLVFIDQVSPQVFDVKEYRSQGTQEVQLSGRLSDFGVPAMALAFHPVIQPDLEWKCEGLGTRDDQPAWIIHFEQRPDRPNVLAAFVRPSGSYAVPLKGRAWVSERDSQVVHLETDLVKEIKPIDLKREHFSIDYKQVSFPAAKTSLWLPENVDTYIQYQGHFLHYYHHFTGFKLFSVSSTQKIGSPKEANAQN
jgi:tetratricopeptide (TPR) repeat protein